MKKSDLKLVEKVITNPALNYKRKKSTIPSLKGKEYFCSFCVIEAHIKGIL